MKKRKTTSSLQIQKVQPRTTKFLWMLLILLIIIAVLGTSIDITGNAPKTIPGKITYQQLHKILATEDAGIVLIESGRESQYAFRPVKQHRFDTKTEMGRKNMQIILRDEEISRNTVRVTTNSPASGRLDSRSKTYLVR